MWEALHKIVPFMIKTNKLGKERNPLTIVKVACEKLTRNNVLSGKY